MAGQLNAHVLLVSLDELTRRFRTGLVRIPAYTRAVGWSQEQVVQLFDSILRGFPVGAMVVVEGPAPAESVRLVGLRVDAPATDNAWSMIDGLQRLAAILGATDARVTDRRFEVYYDPAADAVSGGDVGTRPDVPLLPLAVAADPRSLGTWLQEHSHLDAESVDNCYRLSAALREYRLPVAVLPPLGDGAEVNDIFTRLNTAGRRLTRAEIDRALHTDDHRPEADRNVPTGHALAEATRQSGFGLPSVELMARCVHAVGGDATAAADALAQAVTFLRDTAGVPHIRLLPRPETLPVLTRFAARFGAPAGRPAELLRRWLWRGVTVAPPDPEDLLAQPGHSPLAEAERLLRLLPPAPTAWSPDLGRIRLDDPFGRVNALGMLSARPSLLAPVRSGELLGGQVESTFELGRPLAEPGLLGLLLDAGSELLVRFLGAEAAGRPWEDSMVNSLLHPPSSNAELTAAVLGGPQLDAERLAGHCLDDLCVDLLRAGQYDRFAEHRSGLLARTIAEHVQSYARWGFRDGAGLPSLGGRDGEPSGGTG